MELLNLANCSDCTIRPQKPVLGRGEKGGIVFVVEHPKLPELRDKTPASEHTLEICQKAAKTVGQPFFITNMLLCRPQLDKFPGEIPVKCCGKRLEAEVLAQNPKLVVFMGANAAKVLGMKRGEIFEFAGIPAICTFAPGMVVHNPNAYYDIEQDVINALRTDEISEPEYVFVRNEEELRVILNGMEGPVALDIETTSLDPLEGEITFIGLGELGKPVVQFEPRIFPREEFLALMKRAGGFVVANGTFEWQWFKRHLNVELSFSFDAILAHYALDERGGDSTSGVSRSLKDLSAYYLNAPEYGADNKELFEKSRYGLDRMDASDRHNFLLYNAWDVHCTLLLREFFYPRMIEDDVLDAFENVTMACLPTISALEDRGILVDQNRIDEVDAEISEDIMRLTEELRKCAGNPSFNPNSPKQVGELLFDEWGMPSKNRSVDKSAIAELAEKYDNPFFSHYLSYKALSKIQGTYTRGMKKHIRSDGRIHTRILLYGTETGRLSSRNPNLQNIPNPEKSVLGNTIRSFFIPDPGYVWVKADYSQLELRIAAFLSGDENLTQYFLKGGDMHREVASILFHKPVEEVSKLERSRAKTAVFGIIYGMSEYGAQEKLGMSLSEARDLIGKIESMFPQLVSWAERQVENGKKNRFVRSYFGRKRRFPVLPKEPKALSHIERTMVNTPVQCLASDICLLAANRIEEMKDERILPLLLVHDEIDIMVREDYLSEAAEIIKNAMESVLDSRVPIVAELEVGPNWGQVKSLKV